MRGGKKFAGPRLALLAASLFLIFPLLLAAPARARDLVVYGEPALQSALIAVGSLWRSRSGVRVHVFVAPTDLSLAQIERGARCDVIVGMAEPLAEGERRKLIDSETKAPLFRNALVVVGRSDAALQAPSGNIDLAALLAGKRLALANPDRDVAGRYALEALRKSRVALDPESRSVAIAENSAAVLTYLDENRADLGIVYASDAKSAGAKILIALPEDLYPAIEYVAAETAEPQGDPDEFMDFLGTDEATAMFEAAGLRPIAQDEGDDK
jgi:molybdate transport system substrate-binding protein